MVGHEPGERVVLDARLVKALVRVGVVVEQRHPRAQQHAIDTRLVLGREDPVDVDEFGDAARICLPPSSTTRSRVAL